VILTLLVLGTAPAQESLSMLLLVSDPEGLLQGAPQVTLTNAAGAVLSYSPRDDGALPDIAAGDGLYAQPVLGFQGRQAALVITDGQRSWQGDSSIATDSNTPMLLARLRADGSLEFSDSPPPAAGPEVVETRPELASSEARVRLGWGYWLWAALLSVGGAVLGRGLLRLRSAASAPARLAVTPPVIAPRRIAASELEAACAALIATHRVVVLGPAPPGTIACLDAHPLPGELVAAVEALALSPGPSPALLVTDPTLLAPGSDPVGELERRVGGRFPLVVSAESRDL
jgi:hypothetical protein